MIRRFSSGSSTPASRLQEALASIDHHQLHAEVALEGDAQQLRLALAHEPVVDVDAGQLLADGPMHQRCGDRAVHPAGERADDVAVPTRSRISATVVSTRFAAVQFCRTPAIPTTKLRRTSRPIGVCTTSGWNWMP